MKIAEGLKIIESDWIRKPKGFRVRFHKQTEGGVESGFSPPIEAAPLSSDVTAWRYAWRLGQATRAKAETGSPGALYNITVVDDQDHPVRFHGSGDFETYNAKTVEGVGDTTGNDNGT